MTTTVFKVNISDITPQFFQELQESYGKTAQLEIRVDDPVHGEGLLSEEQFWEIVDKLDWTQKKQSDIIRPAVELLSQMPIAAIYVFHDLLSEKLYRLDTRSHANAYQEKQEDGMFSVDDFLYVRCGVVGEGRSYYDKVLHTPSEMPGDIDFEYLLGLAGEAYLLKTGSVFDYAPLFNYETRSNTEGWK